MTPEPVAVLAEALADGLVETWPGFHASPGLRKTAQQLAAALLALPPDRRAALAAELLDVEGPEPPGGPEWRAFHLLRVELDAARVENARLRTALLQVFDDARPDSLTRSIARNALAERNLTCRP